MTLLSAAKAMLHTNTKVQERLDGLQTWQAGIQSMNDELRCMVAELHATVVACGHSRSANNQPQQSPCRSFTALQLPRCPEEVTTKAAPEEVTTKAAPAMQSEKPGFPEMLVTFGSNLSSEADLQGTSYDIDANHVEKSIASLEICGTNKNSDNFSFSSVGDFKKESAGNDHLNLGGPRLKSRQEHLRSNGQLHDETIQPDAQCQWSGGAANSSCNNQPTVIHDIDFCSEASKPSNSDIIETDTLHILTNLTSSSLVLMESQERKPPESPSPPSAFQEDHMV